MKGDRAQVCTDVELAIGKVSDQGAGRGAESRRPWQKQCRIEM